MYRVLDDRQEVRERRVQLRHPTCNKPQLVATAPNQVWSWDITKLLGPAKWTYFHLYVILDILSRYVVGWMLASRESEHLAERLIRETVVKDGVARNRFLPGTPTDLMPRFPLCSRCRHQYSDALCTSVVVVYLPSGQGRDRCG